MCIQEVVAVDSWQACTQMAVSCPPNVEELARACDWLRGEAESTDGCKSFDDAVYERIGAVFHVLDSWNRRTDINYASMLLSDSRVASRIPVLHRLRALWEYEHEKRIALEILSSENSRESMAVLLSQEYPDTTLHSSWFRQRAMRDWNSCLVVGSGPLPTTVALLHAQTELSVTCVDREPESCRIGAELLQATGAPPTEFIVADARDLDGRDHYDVILVTALTGVSWRRNSPDARNTLLQCLLEAADYGACLLLRSAYGLGALFYPVIDTETLSNYDVQRLTPPTLGRSAMLAVEKHLNVPKY